MLIVTGLGKTRRMEGWWDKHKTDRELQAMNTVTVLQGEDEEHERKYELSTKAVQKLLTVFTDGLKMAPKVFCPEDVGRRFVSMGRWAMDLLLRGQKISLKQEAILKTLRDVKALKEVRNQKDAKIQKEWVSLTEAEASTLAEQFFDENAMEL